MNDEEKVLATARKFALQTGEAKTGEPLHYAVIPNDAQLVSLDAYQFSERPQRIETLVEVTDDESFVGYFADFREDGVSRIFADRATRTLRGYIDYHSVEDPAFLSHTVTLRCVETEEYKAWTQAAGRWTDQAAFAAFIDDNIADITAPSGGAMRDAARDLRAKRNVDFASIVSLETGAATMRYEENIRGTVKGGELEVPETFTITIPVFEGGQKYDIAGRLQFMINEQKKLQFKYLLNKPARRLDEEFNRRIGMIEGALQGQKVLFGKVL